jgi:hypothetical protein
MLLMTRLVRRNLCSAWLGQSGHCFSCCPDLRHTAAPGSAECGLGMQASQKGQALIANLSNQRFRINAQRRARAAHPASTLSGKLRRLNLLCHVFQVRRESICNLARIISRLRDVIAHLQQARKHRQYRD